MKPVKVTFLDIFFGGKISELLPPIEQIPDEFKKGENKWNKVVSDWFFHGLKECKWTPKEGVNTTDALRHIQSIIVSFKLKYKDKETGCAYLLSQFFDNLQYKTIN